MHWNVPPMWKGCPVYILAGGPSLNNVDIDRLRGARVIAVNNAYLLARWIPVMYFMDCKWFGWHDEELAKWPGLRVTTCKTFQDVPWLKFLKHGSRMGLDTRSGHLSRGTNAGYGALALAVKLGGNPIYGFGFDMKQVDGNDNWHTEHKRKTPSNIYEHQFFKPFAAAKAILDERGIQFYNATPGSALPYFPIISLEEAYP